MLHLIADLLRVKRPERGLNGVKPYAVVTVLHSDPNREREILRRIAKISKESLK